MKVKTANLKGPALDWAVAKCGGIDPHIEPTVDGIAILVGASRPIDYLPSTNWSQGGPIIEREQLLFHGNASNGYHCWSNFPPYASGDGPSHLIAAMRCFVANKMGDEVNVPDELLQEDAAGVMESQDEDESSRPSGG